MSCSRTQHGAAYGDRTKDLSIQIPMLYHYATARSPIYVGPGRKPQRWFSHELRLLLYLFMSFKYFCNSRIILIYFYRQICSSAKNAQKTTNRPPRCGNIRLLTIPKNDTPLHEVCNAHFSNRGYLRQHESTHLGPPRYVCQECGQRFVHQSSLSRHYVKHRADMFMCGTCSKTFDRRETLEKHSETHMEKKQCEHCEIRVFHMDDHLKICKNLKTRKPRFVCEHCRRKFLEKRYLREHLISRHQRREQFECKKCNKKFHYRGSLYNHVKKCSQ